MNNLTVLLKGQGKYEAAEEMHRQALELSEKVLGPGHTDKHEQLRGDGDRR